LKKSFFHRLILGTLLGLGATAFIILITSVLWPSLFDAFETKSLDWRYPARLDALWQKRQGNTIENIVIVNIDSRSLDSLGNFSQWPRSYHSRIIDYLSDGGALAIGFDILFMERGRDDKSLTDATRRAENVHHAMVFSSTDSSVFRYAMNSPPQGFDPKFSFVLPDTALAFDKADRMDGKVIDLYNAAAGLGFTNFSPDHDSVIRSMPLFLTFAGRHYPSLAFSMVMGALGVNFEQLDVKKGVVSIKTGDQDYQIPVDDHYHMMINYQGTFQTFRYVSYYDVLTQRIPKEYFDRKIILVGTSAPGLSDIRPVPFQDAFPGVEIHANVIYNILSQHFISKQNNILAFVNTLLLAVLMAVLAMTLKPWQGILLAFLTLGGYVFLTIRLFAVSGFWLQMVQPVLAMGFAFLFVFVYRYVDEEKNKRYIKNMFQYYLSTPVVEELLRQPGMLKLGGKRVIATAIFSDIKNFTTLSENLSPEALVAQLNEYLSAMTEVILKYEGYLDKYEGDAIMAIFGVPVEIKDHARRACLAAMEMQNRLVELRRKWAHERKPEFHARIGINSGPMIAGNIGGLERFDYTVIGDAVNLASRLEGVNKTYGTSILISEFTKDMLDDLMIIRELDYIRVMGKKKPVCIYELVAQERSHVPNAALFALDEFQKGLALYRKKNWNKALQAFQTASAADAGDGPAQTFIKRCLFYKQNPVAHDWDGVFEMKTK
jgi:adenylate cyclase